MGDGVKGFTKFEVNHIHCFPFMHQAKHLVLETYQVGQA